MKKHLGLALATLAVVGSAAPAWADESPWMVRARAVHLDWKNGQSGAVQSLDVHAEKKIIPEVNITYFFFKEHCGRVGVNLPAKG